MNPTTIAKNTRWELRKDEYGFWLYSYDRLVKHLLPTEITDLRALLNVPLLDGEYYDLPDESTN